MTKYILLSFRNDTPTNYKWRKIGRAYKTFDDAVDAMAKDIAKSNKCTVEQWEEDMGGKEEIYQKKGEYFCFLPTRYEGVFNAKYWKIFEV